MKKLNLFFMAFVTFTMVASATSLHPDTFRNDVSPVLEKADITFVASKGKVIKSERFHPFSKFLVSIPVKVSIPSACKTFAGQLTTLDTHNQLPLIQMMGSIDPVNDVCIQIMRLPFDSAITLDFNVTTGGFVPADNIQSKVVNIAPMGLHLVTLDMANESVTVRKVARVHR